MKALILAGGKGTRLLPYTSQLPKPLMPVGEYPVLEIILRQLAAHRITEIVIAVGYLGHLIEAFFEDGKKWSLTISYLRELNPLGTAGCLAEALPQMEDDFLVLNGDLLTTLDFSAMLAAHGESGADATVSIHAREVHSEFGVIEQDAAGWLTAYLEKPWQTLLVSMGCYVFRKQSLLGHLRSGEKLDMPDLILRLRSAGARVKCHQQDCRWLDIGRPEDHRLANEWFAGRASEFLPQ